MLFMAALLAGLICLMTAALDALGNGEWAPIGFILAALFFWIAWMAFP